MDASNSRRVVILGKTGSGKSSVANTIFGDKVFKVNHSLNSEIRKAQAETKSIKGSSITLIDTPGFFDTDRSEEKLRTEIVRCITECAPGPHAFLIVLKVEKFTEHEQDVIKKINEYFSKEVFKYATIVFTHGDQLPEERTIKDLVDENETMRDLVKKCGGRCHVIDNKYWDKNQKDEYRSNQYQVGELLETIDKMVEKNGSCYTNEMLQGVEGKIDGEVANIRQSSANMSEEEIREQAKGSVFNMLLKKLASVTTGALLGAFFGLALTPPIIQALGLGTGVAATATAYIVPAVSTAYGFVHGLDAEQKDTVSETIRETARDLVNDTLSAMKKGKEALDQVQDLKKKKRRRRRRKNPKMKGET